MKFLFSMFVFFAVYLQASVLDNGLVGMSNDGVSISSSADLYEYIKKLDDANLTNAYRDVARPINRLENPYASMSDVATYEDAFANLRYFYSMIYDKNSSKTFYSEVEKIKSKKPSIISQLSDMYEKNSSNTFYNETEKLKLKRSAILMQLTEAKRKQYSDETVVLMLIKYLEYQKQIEYISFLKSKMFETAVVIVKRIYDHDYLFVNNMQELEKQKEIKTAEIEKLTGNAKIIAQNELIVIKNNISFIKAINELQQIKKDNSWQLHSALNFSNESKPYASLEKDVNDSYERAFKNASKSIEDAKINEKISEKIFENYAEYMPTKIVLKNFSTIKDSWEQIQDYTIFVFNNNGIQVLDVIGFLYDVILALIVQYIIIFFLKRRADYGIGHLSIFMTKFIVALYLIYDFATNVLSLNAGNLAMFASAFSIAIGFGMQSIIQNFVAGIILLGDKTLQVGDRVKLGDKTEGDVVNITYRTTTIKTDDNTLVVVPNSKIFLDTIENQTKSDKKIRLKALLLVEAGANLPDVEAILVNACKKIPGFIDNIAPQIVIKTMNKDGILLEIRLFIEDSDLCDDGLASRILYDELYEAKSQS